MHEILEQLSAIKLIPVVKIDNAADSAPLCEALIEGGLPVAEITFRTAAAAEAIKIAAGIGDMIVGAGTVLTVDQVKAAVDAGAKFIISPGIDEEVTGYCVDNNIPITPGIATPTDIQKAIKLGLEVVKFFPAEAFGGLKTLKAISAPYGNMRFIPTGGIDAGNILDYLAFPKVLACGGSWMVKGELITGKKFGEIT
ncbi:MAG: bifunctional 4-hydroxy-2-oxoglutarate aldolase/2-dehydro-3-deoxy-phosphogluconate aldolase, partial [Planctomycetes bacterium]|nr:bifunctional 4-hydroxy-2-oxoglutarate aldolase/2-dehydro-3-deoxy-phosphogluconate aldolase [Planctomycetota bacterium]